MQIRIAQNETKERYVELPLCEIKEKYEKLPGGKEFVADIVASAFLRLTCISCSPTACCNSFPPPPPPPPHAI